MNFMKFFKYILFCFIIAFSFLQCKSSRFLKNDLPLKVGSVYYQDVISNNLNVKKGFKIYIPIISNSNHIILDSVYFRGKVSKLTMENESLYSGFFKNSTKPDIVMSSNLLDEYGNTVPKIPQKQIFQLKEDECMVGYVQNDTLNWFKITNISFKPLF